MKQPNAASGLLLVMIKPDGVTRMCTVVEVQVVHDVWVDLLAWLRGADPDTLRRATLIGEIAQKAALQMIRYPEYDIGTWASQAGPDISHPSWAGHEKDQASLSEVAAGLLREIGLIEDEKRYSGWLNRITIELLYGNTPMFQSHRELLVPQLLKGPVIIQQWRGPRAELAHAVKLAVRRSRSTSDLTNLIHTQLIAEVEHGFIAESLFID